MMERDEGLNIPLYQLANEVVTPRNYFVFCDMGFIGERGRQVLHTTWCSGLELDVTITRSLYTFVRNLYCA